MEDAFGNSFRPQVGPEWHGTVNAKYRDTVQEVTPRVSAELWPRRHPAVGITAKSDKYYLRTAVLLVRAC